MILSACYLLWSYQRVFFGVVTHEKNRELADADTREKWMLATMAVVVLWMGIGSPFFTRRFAVSCQAVIDQMARPFAREAALPSAIPNAAAPVSSGTFWRPISRNLLRKGLEPAK